VNEAQIVKKLILGLKARLPNAVIDKHSDRVVRNVPDLSVDYGGFTTWIEVKYLRAGETPSRRRVHFNESQLVRNERRAWQADCRYFVAYQYDDDQLYAATFRPKNVRRALAQDPLDLMSHAITKGRFNDVVATLAQSLKEKARVYNLCGNEDEEAADSTSGPEGTVALRRGRRFTSGEVPARGLARRARGHR
jgi:hypothetical protein